MAQHNDLGMEGEALAEKHFRDKGFRILERNWLHRKLEIDIIASNDEVIVFAEVKTRSTRHWGNPEDSVSDAKIRRIVEAADFYLKENDIDTAARFDIVAIVITPQLQELEHIEDAFMTPLS